MSDKAHWEAVYQSKTDAEFSWTQSEPSTSLALVHQAAPTGSVIDVGGGTSRLAAALLDAGYTVSVLDISAAALSRARAALGARADDMRLIAADVTAIADVGTFDVWHDRAAFHFLTEPAERAAYIALLSRSVPAGGHAVIATFALDGPEQCSGLPVRRYDGPTLAAELGAGFERLRTVPETHVTPWGNTQSFQYSLFRRV